MTKDEMTIDNIIDTVGHRYTGNYGGLNGDLRLLLETLVEQEVAKALEATKKEIDLQSDEISLFMERIDQLEAALAATQFVPIADAPDEWKGMDVLLGRWNDYAGTIVDMAWGYWDKDNGTWEDEWSKTWTHVALKPAVRGAE